MRARGQTHAGPHAPDHPTTSHPRPRDDGAPMHAGRLGAVARDAAARWFVDALRLAKNGDANQAAVLAEMLEQGYGCVRDEEEARYWKQVARNAGGRRVEGVYDELP